MAQSRRLLPRAHLQLRRQHRVFVLNQRVVSCDPLGLHPVDARELRRHGLHRGGWLGQRRSRLRRADVVPARRYGSAVNGVDGVRPLSKRDEYVDAGLEAEQLVQRRRRVSLLRSTEAPPWHSVPHLDAIGSTGLLVHDGGGAQVGNFFRRGHEHGGHRLRAGDGGCEHGGSAVRTSALALVLTSTRAAR